MAPQPMTAAVLAAQKAWALRTGCEVDPAGYLPDYGSNLCVPLSPAAKAAFERGSGSELLDGKARAAKMRALHSSSALAVNVFDFWNGRDLGRVLAALGVEGRATGLSFEEKLRTGAGGSPPNLDVVIRLDDGRLVGVESKFTEWMTPKKSMAASLAPYVDKDEASYWSRAGLPASHRLVLAMRAGKEKFRHLDVPQLLKHALGLHRASEPGWYLGYLYFDAPGKAQEAHAEEIARFEGAVGDELRFRASSYQAFVASLGPAGDEAEADYLGYLADRYFGG
jgi:hypothetical protein